MVPFNVVVNTTLPPWQKVVAPFVPAPGTFEITDTSEVTEQPAAEVTTTLY